MLNLAAVKINPGALTAARERAGHTQASLSRESTVNQSWISQLERLDDEGQPREIRPPTAKRLADALGVDIGDITISEPVEVQS